MLNSRTPKRTLLLLLNTLIILFLFIPPLIGSGPLPSWPILFGLYLIQGLLLLTALQPATRSVSERKKESGVEPPAGENTMLDQAPEPGNAVFLTAWILCAAVAFGIYGFTLNSFFHEDDLLHLGKALPWIYGTRSLGSQLAGLPMWLGEYFRPLVGLIWTLGVKAAGLSPAPYHAALILLHATNGLILVSITRLLGGSTAAGIIAGLIFVSHPVHTETVSHLAAGFDNQPALFLFLLAIRAFLKKSELKTDGIPVSPASLLLFFLALLNKEMAVSLPVIIFLYMVISGKRGRSLPVSFGRGVLATLPYAIPFAVYLCLRLIFLDGVGGMVTGAGENLNFSLRPDMLMRTLAFTLPRFVLFPINTEAHGHHDILFAVFGMGAALMTFAGSYTPARNRPIFFFLAIWSLAVLLPAYNIAHINSDFLNSRFLFFSVVPLSILAGFFLAGAPRARVSAIFRYGATAGGILLLSLTAQTNNLPRKQAAEDCKAMMQTIRDTQPVLPPGCRLYFIDMPHLAKGVNRFVYPEMLTSALFLDYPDVYGRVSEVGFLNGGTGENYRNSYPELTSKHLGERDFVYRWLPGERRLEDVSEQLKNLFLMYRDSAEPRPLTCWLFESGQSLDGWRLVEGAILRDDPDGEEGFYLQSDRENGDLLLESPLLNVSLVQAGEIRLIVSELPDAPSIPQLYLDWTTPDGRDWSVYRTLSGDLESDSTTGNMVLDISGNAPLLLEETISRIRIRITDFGQNLPLRGIAVTPKTGKDSDIRAGLVFNALARGKKIASLVLAGTPGTPPSPLVVSFLRAVRVFEGGDPERATGMFTEIEGTAAAAEGELAGVVEPLAGAGACLSTAVYSPSSDGTVDPGGEGILPAALVAPYLGIVAVDQIAEDPSRLREARVLAESILAEYPGEPTVIRSLAGVYERLDRFDLAQPLWKKLFFSDPAGPSGKEALGHLHPERNRWKIYRHAEGSMYLMKLDSTCLGDDESNNNRSILRLYENGQPLGPAHAPHSEIARVGGGGFSHWKDMVFFSTSDNSDPNENGRSYYLQLDPDLFTESRE